MNRTYDTFERQVERAERAARDFSTDKKKEWFLSLLEILKQKKYARIMLCTSIPKQILRMNNMKLIDTARPVDVQRIAYTGKFASFFDIINNSDLVDYETQPIAIDRLERPYIYY